MRTSGNFFVVAALGIPLALSACLTGVAEVGHADASVGNCEQVSNQVDLANDARNCGSCGMVCPSGNSCHQGQCVVPSVACAAGVADCNAKATDGCETALLTDPANCGACGAACQSNQTCVAGICSGGSEPCYGNFADCDGLATNGCEIDLSGSTNNCGVCGKVCAPGTSCVAGSCTNVCAAGFMDCDGNTANGCEVNSVGDSSNCGACGKVCANGDTCSGGSCVAPGQNCSIISYSDCNGDPADGCEVDLVTSLTNCGACGNVCSASNAKPLCYSGSCSYLSCNSGFDDCDKDRRNGCEVNLKLDSNHCGTCENICPTGQTCVQGSCVTQSTICPAGYANCDGNANNGCEVNLVTDSSNCGSCGAVCSRAHATAKCSTGACSILTCDGSYGDCDGNTSNGCETDLETSKSHCGICGIACASGKQCTAGECG